MWGQEEGEDMGSISTTSGNLSAQTAALSPAALLAYATRDHSDDARWQTAPHLEYLDGQLLDAVNGKAARLLISMPPRMGKSTLISQGLPAWYVGSNPDRRVITCAHTATLASDFSGKAKDLLEEAGDEVFGVTIDPKQSARDIHDR